MSHFDEDYEIHLRCQICCVDTPVRKFHRRYCEKCQGSLDLVPIPISEWYEKGNSLIELSSEPGWVGRPMVGFG